MTQSAEEIDCEVAPVIERLKAPYLAIHGEALDARYVAWLRAAIPHAEIETWNNGGHWLHLVEPERFLERVIPFLAKGAG
jgi:pimeloyl-ACP methyl ester carboxylesterase